MTFIETQNNIKILVSMVEVAYSLPHKHEDFMVAINLVDAELGQVSEQEPFAREQERFEMMMILNSEHVEHSKGKKLDLELLPNGIRSVFWITAT